MAKEDLDKYRRNHEAHLARGIPAVYGQQGEYTYCLTQCIHQHGRSYCAYRQPAAQLGPTDSSPVDMFGNDLTKTDSFGTPRGAVTLDLKAGNGDVPCEACKDIGWLLMDNDEHGLRIERCDSCQKFGSDEEAVTYVAATARGHELYLAQINREVGHSD